MPTYEYACPDCGVFAAVRRMAESGEPSDCPACGMPAPRIVSAPAWLGASARQRRHDATSPPARPAARPRAGHGMACVCCAPPRLRPGEPAGAGPGNGR